VVAVDAGYRVVASGVHWKPGVIVTASHLVRRAVQFANMRVGTRIVSCAIRTLPCAAIR
jgi:hypothetical protein